MKVQDFEKLLTQISEILPTQESFSKLSPYETHHLPENMIRAGQKLGQVREILKNREEFLKTGFFFYQKCAKNKKVSKLH